MTDQPPLCVLHIGKTGGSYLRSVLRRNRKRWGRPIDLLGHDATLPSTRRSHGPDRRLGLTIRDPETRFVSAFYSRLRQGRPTYQFNWSADEAAAFHWFSEAETLAQALTSTDEREKSAAYFAMASIQHIRDGYAFYLGSQLDLIEAAPQIAFCVDVTDLDARLDQVMAACGLPEYEFPKEPRRHESPTPLPPLSGQAREALRVHWEEEFRLYEIAKTLGPTG